MKILQLCNKVPFPPKDGGCIAMNNFTQGHTVKVLAINTPKHLVEMNELPAEYHSKTNIEAVFVDTSVKLAGVFLNLFSSKSYNVSRFYSSAFEKKLIELLTAEKYDVVQLESIYVSIYVDAIRKYSSAKVVLRAHNVENLLWKRTASQISNPLKQAYIRMLANKLEAYEKSVIKKVDAIAAITDADTRWFKSNGCINPVETFPFGIEFKSLGADHKSQKKELSVFNIGAMDWMPNVDGLKWFLKDIWKNIHKQHPQIKLFLAGRNMPAWLSGLNMQNVIVEGEVADAHQFMRLNSIMVVPLLSGGGMRVKIIEGMALGKTIVTTAVGAEGIAYRNNEHLLIADTAAEFAEAVNKCISDTAFAENIGKNASSLVEDHYDNQKICKRLTDFYQTLISK